MKNCQKCGYSNPDDAKYCVACGYPFPESTSEQQTPSQPQPAPESPKRPFPLFRVIAAVVAIVIVIGVVAILLNTNSVFKSTPNFSAAADNSFGGNWMTQKNESGVAQRSNNSIVITYLNGSTTSIPLSQILNTPGNGILFTASSKLEVYDLVNGTNQIVLEIFTYNSTTSMSMINPLLTNAEAYYTAYNYSKGTFYLTQGEAFTTYGLKLFIVDFYNFMPTVQNVTTFLNQIVS
ncbi:zinc ribbon domain-containing protein [Sulfolobus acidocaldarius]|uniref:Zinc-ribbon domain-containing protein n=4 Tax=Sulfolobus acidocaldarius TaxID=2285 RepID=Q4J6X9_SULAC|nr:zinc ribbon domain-containing protein [Sulfolobus acidocaldarius]AAY81453.1 hypothetical protein Saci_2163 [Sulfolobus acidocaldarius DSM 639]AGE72055.1 hypothetical protein SacN8_10525 [Sulfolobus acidocaldarius N8]AGE74372.1 hypothetical protein SacRon12I_10780 [Sulfolobus acidocaldarius Ron12/I]ALU29758.1 hypothetical protein ATY89_07275 [Sulfolobus acidocaldarius]ALU32495.1 hypothetical protein ATZ20_10295 [Sulfolobus acidocaldarius]